MLPKPPPREGALGFLYVPPFRVQGVSVAGEATCVQVPELDVCFDMGICPRRMPSRARSWPLTRAHGSHRRASLLLLPEELQGMGVGTIVCDIRIEKAVRRMLEGFHDLEGQRTPFELIPMAAEDEYEIKNNIAMRAFQVEHTAPAFGYVVFERRTKLKEKYVGFPQEKLRELKEGGEEITRKLEAPLVAYLGDTEPGTATGAHRRSHRTGRDLRVHVC